jgi:hypothetical protein
VLLETVPQEGLPVRFHFLGDILLFLGKALLGDILESHVGSPGIDVQVDQVETVFRRGAVWNYSFQICPVELVVTQLGYHFVVMDDGLDRLARRQDGQCQSQGDYRQS